MKISLDTNVFIALMNREANFHSCELIFDAIDKHFIEVTLSTIVVAEVLVGFYQSDNSDGKEKFLNKLKVNYEILPVTLELAEQAAQIRVQIVNTHRDVRIIYPIIISKPHKKVS